MPDRNWPLGGLATLFTLLTLSLVGSSSPGPPADGKARPAPGVAANPRPPGARVAPLSDKDPYKPFADFWALSDPGRAIKYVNQSDGRLLDPEQSEVEFLIATVPDPIDTRFVYRFDSILDDIQMAIESQGWNLDHFWFPWLPPGDQPNRRDDVVPVVEPQAPARVGFSARADLGGRPLLAVSGGFEPEKAASATPPDRYRLLPMHHREPGVLLFRKKWEDPADWHKPQQLLALFLVGETPTTGIHKIPLSMTLDIIREIQARRAAGRVSTPTPAPAFRIVGPNYSGSERSLSYVIKEWSARQEARPGGGRWDFRVRSGGASGIDQAKFVGDCGPKLTTVSFDATVIHSSDVIEPLLEYLKTLNGGRNLGRIALLTESDTAYGNDSAKFSRKDPPFDLTEMKFPFHISQVAIAYEKNRRDKDGATPALIRSSNKLRIPFDEVGNPRDVVPSLSPAMSSATDEFVMARILDTISKEHYRYVGIFATDTRDTIFLAGLVRDYCPDVQLFVPSGDLLLGHPEYAPQLQGTIIASTYPLFSMAQRWDPPHNGDRRRHLFSHESDQGYYNATLSLLGEGHPGDENYFKAMYDYGRPFDEFEDISLFWEPRPGVMRGEKATPAWTAAGASAWGLPKPARAERPALWFGVIGQRGLWPVGFVDDPRDFERPGYVHAEPIAGEVVRSGPFARQFIPLVAQFTWQWGSIHLLLTAVVGFVIWNAARPGRPGFHSPWRSILFEPFDEHPRPRLKFQHDAAVVTGLLILLALYIHFAANPCWIALQDSSWKVFWTGGTREHMSSSDRNNWNFGLVAITLSHVATVGLALVLVGPLARKLPGWDRARGWASAHRGIVAAGVAAGFVGAWCLLFSAPIDRVSPSRSLAYPLLYFERAVNLGDGVSPLMPALILALAAFTWLFCQLRRIYLHAELRTKAPIPRPSKARPRPFGPIEARDGEIDELISSFLPIQLIRRPAGLLGVLVAAIVALRLLMTIVPTVDGDRFNSAMIGSICLLIFAVLVSLYRFAALWGRIKSLLVEIAALPRLLPAFDRIPARYSHRLGRYLDAVGPRLADLAIPIEQWARVAGDRPRIESEIGHDPALMKKIRKVTSTGRVDYESPLARLLAPIGPKARTPREVFDADLYPPVDAVRAVARTATRRRLRRAAVACLEILSLDWDDPRPAAGRSTVGPAPGVEGPAKVVDPAGWREKAEDLVAIEFVTYIAQCATHLRNLASMLGIVPVLLLLAVSVYPFQPQRFLIFALVGLLLVVVSGVIAVYVQMDRNEVLSRISRSTPNKVTFDRAFLANIATFLVPVIGLVISQFPSFSDTLNQWFDPILRSLK